MNAKQSIKDLMPKLNDDGLYATEIYNMGDDFSSLFVLYRDIKIKDLIENFTKQGSTYSYP